MPLSTAYHPLKRGLFAALLLALGLIVLPLQGLAQSQGPQANPERSTGKTYRQAAHGQSFMAVTAHPAATQVAVDILSRGGTAADAGIAAQLMLGLVEPQSSGLGGGGFALYYDARTQNLSGLDGRETAPALAGKHLFRGQDGQKMDFYAAAVGGRAVGTPGLPAMLEKLHKWHGKLAWRDLFTPAITMAETGFEASPRLAALVEGERGRMGISTETKLYFFPDTATPVQPGYVMRNPKYAATLRRMALEGAGVFYTGDIARNIVETVQKAPGNPGLLSIEDMAGYKVKERQPVCGGYRGYKVCSIGEPSSGGLTLLMILGMLEHFDLSRLGPGEPKSWHLIAEASRLAFADRNYYMADADVVKTPGTALLDPEYLKNRAALISMKGPMESAMPGVPPGWKEEAPAAPDKMTRPPGTTHISIVDSYGNILSVTSSIENAFGSRLMVDGFLLNNQLTDFSFEPDYQGKPVANRVEGGKRPRSSMTPVILFDPSGKPVLAIGSAGGSAIIGYVLERIVAVVDWKMDIQRALDMANILNRGGALEVEAGEEKMAQRIKNLGHPVEINDLNSGLTAIHIKPDGYYGAADPRREGLAAGR